MFVFCFFPTCNFRLLAVRTKRVLSSAKPGAWKKQRLRAPGQSCAPHWKAPNTYRWTWAHVSDHCLFDFLCSHSSACVSFHKHRPDSKLENGENVQSSISMSLWQLDIPRISAGSDEPEKPVCNHCFYQALFFWVFFTLPGFLVFKASVAPSSTPHTSEVAMKVSIDGSVQ